MNMEMALMLNQSPDRFVIDAGRERPNFAVGDKVMATKNDHEAGITNGMTGIIIGIEEHAGYRGEKARFGRVEDVNRYLADIDDDEEDISLEDIMATMAAQEAGKEKTKESRDRGPASHIVTVRFGEGEHALELPFSTLAEVATLSMAYTVTCHKMQGGEGPHIFTIAHHVHKQMLFREWLYTAWTRASERSVMLYTPYGLRNALNKQRIKGKTLIEKVQSFQQMQKVYEDAGLNRFSLPAPRYTVTGEPITVLPQYTTESNELENPDDEPSKQIVPTFGAKASPPPPSQPERVIIVERERVVERVVVVEPRREVQEEPADESEVEVVEAEYVAIDSPDESAPADDSADNQPLLEHRPAGVEVDYAEYNPHRWDIAACGEGRTTRMVAGLGGMAKDAIPNPAPAEPAKPESRLAKELKILLAQKPQPLPKPVFSFGGAKA